MIIANREHLRFGDASFWMGLAIWASCSWT